MQRRSVGYFPNARIDMVCLDRLFFISLCLTYTSFNYVFVVVSTSQGGIGYCTITLLTSLSLFSSLLRNLSCGILIRLWKSGCMCLFGIFENVNSMFQHFSSHPLPAPPIRPHPLGAYHASFFLLSILLCRSLNTRVSVSPNSGIADVLAFFVFLSPLSSLSLVWSHFLESML